MKSKKSGSDNTGKQDIFARDTKDGLKKGLKLKYLNRYRDFGKEIKTDRKVGYGKYTESSSNKGKGSFKKNSHLGLSNVQK